ncbi:30S ribosomal protein S9 [bacterium]|nr:30S ribosomal protein S9 [bacterium]
MEATKKTAEKKKPAVAVKAKSADGAAKPAKAPVVKVVKPASASKTKSGSVETSIKVPAGAFYGTGKRKTSIAKVWLFKGNGTIVINGQAIGDYLPTDIEVKQVLRPLQILGLADQYDAKIVVLGGGLMGQAGAAQHGISRALLRVSPDNRKPLKDEGFLTRDPRVKERKKYGRKRARKGFQFRKR